MEGPGLLFTVVVAPARLRTIGDQYLIKLLLGGRQGCGVERGGCEKAGELAEVLVLIARRRKQ